MIKSTNKFNVFVSVLLSVILAFSMLGLAGCSGGSSNKFKDLESGPVAATAYGENIYENYITSLIEAMRKQNNAEDNESWQKYLQDNQLAVNEVRNQMIQRRVAQIRTDKLAADYSISVTDDEVNSEVDKTKKTFSNDDDWNNYLSSTGQTELSYFYDCKTSLLERKMREAQIGAPSFGDIDETLRKQYTKMYAQAFNTSKRASWILLENNLEELTDEANPESDTKKIKEAKDLVSEIKSGSKSFEDAAKEKSIDNDTKNNGGDLGWDASFENIDYAVSQALQNLNKGDVSDPVTFTFHEETGNDPADGPSVNPLERIAIVKCTDVANFSADTDNIDDFPDGLKEYVEKLIVQIFAQNAYDDLSNKKLEEADTQINDMPQDLPYIIS